MNSLASAAAMFWKQFVLPDKFPRLFTFIARCLCSLEILNTPFQYIENEKPLQPNAKAHRAMKDDG